MPTVDRLANECIELIFDIVMRDRTSRPLAQEFLTVADPATLQPWRSLLARKTPGTLPRTIPVFLAQGSKTPWFGRRSRGAICSGCAAPEAG